MERGGNKLGGSDNVRSIVVGYLRRGCCKTHQGKGKEGEVEDGGWGFLSFRCKEKERRKWGWWVGLRRDDRVGMCSTVSSLGGGGVGGRREKKKAEKEPGAESLACFQRKEGRRKAGRKVRCGDRSVSVPSSLTERGGGGGGKILMGWRRGTRTTARASL